ncbi:hypothetical protein [Pseudomonas sp. SJZ079]|nr:hypothetical protein [Pseudomonas sp. SJZ079]
MFTDQAQCSFAKTLAEHLYGSGLLGKATTAPISPVVKRDLDILY